MTRIPSLALVRRVGYDVHDGDFTCSFLEKRRRRWRWRAWRALFLHRALMVFRDGDSHHLPRLIYPIGEAVGCLDTRISYHGQLDLRSATPISLPYCPIQTLYSRASILSAASSYPTLLRSLPAPMTPPPAPSALGYLPPASHRAILRASKWQRYDTILAMCNDAVTSRARLQYKTRKSNEYHDRVAQCKGVRVWRDWGDAGSISRWPFKPHG